MKAREPKKQKRQPRPRRDRYPAVLIPVQDGFEMLGIGITHGYALIARGVLDSVKIGRRRYLTRKSIERVASNIAPPPSQDETTPRPPFKAMSRSYERVG
jgi:hypothetical protein